MCDSQKSLYGSSSKIVNIKFAHNKKRSTNGSWISFAVFKAKSTTGNNSDNQKLLQQLSNKVRGNGLKVDKSALAFMKNGRTCFFGTPDLVNHLSKSGMIRTNNSINI